DDLERELRAGPYWWKTVAVKIRYEDFQTLTRQESIPNHAQETWAARRIIPRLLDEFLEDPRPIRLVGLRLSDLQHAPTQTDLPSYVKKYGEGPLPKDPVRPRGQQRLGRDLA